MPITITADGVGGGAVGGVALITFCGNNDDVDEEETKKDDHLDH